MITDDTDDDEDHDGGDGGDDSMCIHDELYRNWFWNSKQLTSPAKPRHVMWPNSYYHFYLHRPFPMMLSVATQHTTLLCEKPR